MFPGPGSDAIRRTCRRNPPSAVVIPGRTIARISWASHSLQSRKCWDATPMSSGSICRRYEPRVRRNSIGRADVIPTALVSAGPRRSSRFERRFFLRNALWIIISILLVTSCSAQEDSSPVLTHRAAGNGHRDGVVRLSQRAKGSVGKASSRISVWASRTARKSAQNCQ